MLSQEQGLAYVHELQYSNGAVYRGQIKAVDKTKRAEMAAADLGMLSPSESRNSVQSISINEQRSRRSFEGRFDQLPKRIYNVI